MAKIWKPVCLMVILALVLSLGVVLLAPQVQASPGGIVNGDFETGDLTGRTVGGLGAHVEVLQATDFVPNIPVPQGSYFVLLSTGPDSINPDLGPDLDGNTYPDNDTATLSQTFTLSPGEVPATLSFDWSFLTSEAGPYPEVFDDFFQVTLNGTPILTGSVPTPPATSFVSPFPDVPSLDGVSYTVASPGLTNGSLFNDGRCAFQTFTYQITTPSTYTLEFLVADQQNHGVDSGLLIDVVLPLPPPAVGAVGGEVYPINKLNVLAPWLGLILLLAIGGGIFALRRRRAH